MLELLFTGFLIGIFLFLLGIAIVVLVWTLSGNAFILPSDLWLCAVLLVILVLTLAFFGTMIWGRLM